MGPGALQPQSYRVLLEVCTDCLQGSVDAEASGADRIELNQCMEMGGLTPSIGLLRLVIAEVRIPVIVMVRPRAGGFVYPTSDRRVILADAVEALSAGAAGIAFGVLTADGLPDERFIREMRQVTEGSELVFHRAFDLVSDMSTGLAVLASTGVDRVLTSGGGRTALEGLGRIGELVRRSGGRPLVMPGGGVTPENAVRIVLGSGCREIHGSFSSPAADAMDGGGLFEGGGRRTDHILVERTRRVLDGLAAG